MDEPQKIKFTKRKIESLTPPGSGYVVYHDTQTPGLKLRLSKAGTATFFVYRKIKGSPEKITVGRFPQITVEQARNQAAQINAAIANGENPNQVKRRERQEMTLGELYQIYMERHAKAQKKAWTEDEERYRVHLKRWQNRRLSSITKDDCINLHKKIGSNSGHYAANGAFRIFRAMLNKAIEWDYFGGPNPVRAVKLFKEHSRERFIEGHEMAAFFQAVAEEDNTEVRDYILLSLLTGARQDNVLSMRWADIELNTKTWRLPQEVTKGGRALTIPLVDEAVALLEQRRATAETEFVLPSKTSSTGRLINPNKGWRRILERAELKDLRLHDIRRTMGSWQAKTGASLPIIGKSLGHKNINTTMIYARLDVDPVRQSMETAVRAMREAAQQEVPKNVVSLK